MTDFDQFERGLAAALRADADDSIRPFRAAAVAQAATASHPRRATRIRWNQRTLNYARFAVVATVAVTVVGGALYLFRPDRNAIGPSGAPDPSPTAVIAATTTPTVPPGTSQPGIGAWTETASMSDARLGFTATLLQDGRVLITGGSAVVSRSAELYDPTDATWTVVGLMIHARLGHSATLLPDGRVLVAGGDGATRSAELFDPRDGSWTVTDGNMTRARAEHTALLLRDGTVLILGGSDAGPAELYDPAEGTWTAVGGTARVRHGASATLLPDGRVLVVGGYYPDAASVSPEDRLSTSELYDPIARTWASTTDIHESFHGHTATLLPDGTVLIASGDAPSGPGARGHPHAALYDPATGVWTAASDLLIGRLGHTATLLASGQVLVAGGRFHGGIESEAFAETELYDPATAAWTPAADMVRGRSQHLAVTLADGRVLVLGGYGEDGNPTASAEIFDLVRR